MGRTQKLAAIIKEGVRNPQKIKKGLKVLKNQGPEIFKQRLSASVNYEPGYGRVKKEKLKNYSGEILFSIVMPVYNVEIKWLDKAIESIEKQNYKNWEICIADDCSTKQEVREHLSAMKNSRIKIKLLEKNQGISEQPMRQQRLHPESISFLWIMMMSLHRLHYMNFIRR